MAEPEVGCEDTQFQMCDTTAQVCTNPSFVKTIRSSTMLTGHLELPAMFVKDHGHNFHATAVLQGPSGGMKSVHLRIQSDGQDRVYFRGAEWRDFMFENGFMVGHELLFSLVSTSTFTVRLSDSASTAEVKRHSLSVEQQQQKQQRRRGRKIVPTSNYTSSYRSMKPPSSYLSEMSSNTRPSGNGKNDVVYATSTLRFKREVEARVENLSKNLQCPHFVTIMGKSHLRDYRSSALGVPVKFMEKYGMYFSKVHYFQGPSGSIMEIQFSAGARKYARFSIGWKEFRIENGFNLGDVLLFSLRAPACWLVQVVDRRGEELVIGELCVPSDDPRDDPSD